MKRISFQGERGAYSEQAGFAFFGRDVETLPQKTIGLVFDAVERGDADYGILPVENSVAGNIYETYDNLIEREVRIAGETYLRIHHFLIGIDGSSIERIERIYSHPQAIEQCRKFLASLNAELVPTYDTAGSVRLIKEMEDATAVAIAGEAAADAYGLKILKRNIEDYQENITRFIVISRETIAPQEGCKSSIVFSVEDRPGSLCRALKIFSDRNINLTKIESRPVRGRPWEYMFIADLEGHAELEPVSTALRELESSSNFMKLLGSYKKGVIV
jgi:prephenate dehydratase